jgi:hypothetical protein
MSILTPAQLARVRRFQEGGATEEVVAEEVVNPYVSRVDKVESRMDPITQQLLFGLDGQGGFIPGAFRAAERTFFDEEGRPIVIPQEIAGFSPDQIRAMELARQNVGVQQPFIDEAMRRGQLGIGALQTGLEDQNIASQRALDEIRQGSQFALDQRDRGLMDALGGTQQGRGRAMAAEERLRGDLSDLSKKGVRDTQRFGMDLARARDVGVAEAQRRRQGLGESQQLLRGTTDDFDIGAATQDLQDPFENQVVQQMIEDATAGLAKQDMAQFARDVATGGESAFGSRARLSAGERAEALGRGLAKSVGGLRSQGFQRAQQTAISEDERERAAARAAASGLASLGGQDYAAGTDVGGLIQSTAQDQLGAQTRLGSQLGDAAQQRYAAGTGLGSTLASLGQQDAAARARAGQTGMGVAGQLADQYGRIGADAAAGGQALSGAQSGYGRFMAGLGSQAQQAGAADVAGLQGIGSMTQLLRQRELDAQRAGLMEAQAAPLRQYQALMPFVNMVPKGETQFQTQFTPPPNALQAGLGTGLSAFGTIGNYYNPSAGMSGSGR